ncbi:MAG TPA: ARMT1-like domain-containing protein [Desulfobacteraceae bacterium]|nr:ARMT1-like domain-containing protein [Desulfobacteraceae bacterium]HPJ68693.1 ARMT1-like domain-containing protein [Desulfobacteraceae bacterium]HPQ29014.1 ARMT1-like domain-containing protein [Desulfobacteraceae bacterium]
MRTYLDCFPCFLKQALRIGRIATEDEDKIKKLLNEVGMMLKDIPADSTPPESGMLIHQKVREIIGNNDPYREIKDETTRKALSMYPSLKKKVEESEDRLMTAIRISAAGNVMDFGVTKEFDIEKDVAEILGMDFTVCDYSEFVDCLDKTDNILFIGDNAGECVFDRILIEEMNKPTVYVVRDIPVINDATYDDAVQAGIDKVATIMSSGTKAPGTVLKTCSDDFRAFYNSSSFIISKGQGNYEGLSSEKKPVFFLLKAKCHVIADDIGVEEGNIILKGINIKGTT